jgi:hypothetical protein
VRQFLITLCVTAGLIASCDHKPAESATARTGPAFDPVVFFDGHTMSWGVIENRSGAPTESIVTDSHGWINAARQLRMVQHLSFQDGKTQERDWTLWRTGPDRFEATANDMVGSATGETDGRMFHWEWVLARSPGNPLMNVTMSQWMYGLEDGSAMIRTTISKFGVIVAEVTERFSHPETADSHPKLPVQGNPAADERQARG